MDEACVRLHTTANVRDVVASERRDSDSELRTTKTMQSESSTDRLLPLFSHVDMVTPSWLMTKLTPPRWSPPVAEASFDLSASRVGYIQGFNFLTNHSRSQTF